MSVTFAQVPKDQAIMPLVIVGDADAFIARYCVESTAICDAGVTPSDWSLSDRQECRIDLGGMVWLGAPEATIDIDGVKFVVDATRAEQIAAIWDRRGRERVPGWWRTCGWHWFYVMPIDTYRRVHAWLREVGTSAEATDAVIQERGHIAGIEAATTHFRRFSK